MRPVTFLLVEDNPDHADLITETVDATAFVKGNEGWKMKLRKWYWGFDFESFPVNGRVWYPDGDGPFPLVLIVHGNHSMEEHSDPGYGWLGKLMASRGFILVSVDENFFNGGFMDGLNRGMIRFLIYLELEEWDLALEQIPIVRELLDAMNSQDMTRMRDAEAAILLQCALLRRLLRLRLQVRKRPPGKEISTPLQAHGLQPSKPTGCSPWVLLFPRAKPPTLRSDPTAIAPRRRTDRRAASERAGSPAASAPTALPSLA